MMGFTPLAATPLSDSTGEPVVLTWRRVAPVPSNTWTPVNTSGGS
jgi:hypothetical protein